MGACGTCGNGSFALPGYQAKMKEARILPKFRFRSWIDKDESQWKKLDIQCIDTVTWGLFLARIHKGSRIIIEQTRINNDGSQPLEPPMRVSQVEIEPVLKKSIDLTLGVFGQGS